MQTVIDHIELRTSNLSAGGWNVDPETLTFRGRSTVQSGQSFCGMITSSTGLESIVVEPQGGSSFSGGSNFVSSRAQDREVVLTIEPQGRTQNELKNALNRFISLSRDRPLTFAVFVNVYGDDGSVRRETFSAETFLTNISSPIFDIQTSLQVTFKMGSPLFVSENVFHGENTRFGGGNGFWYGNLSLGDEDIATFNAPGTFNIVVAVPGGTILRSISIIDVEGDRVTYSPDVLIQIGIGTLPRYQYARFILDGEKRTFGLNYTNQHQGTVSLPYNVEGRWPSVRPVNTPLRVEIRADGTRAPYSAQHTQMTYHKAVYGF